MAERLNAAVLTEDRAFAEALQSQVQVDESGEKRDH